MIAGFPALSARAATARDRSRIRIDLEPLSRVAYAFHSVIFHLGKSVWPVPLHVHYPLSEPNVTPLSIPLVFSLIAVVAETGGREAGEDCGDVSEARRASWPARTLGPESAR
jgi:hypothetical protein